MRRLTPDKIRGYRLPNAPRINKGNTSIIYATSDPAFLEVFTTEWIKLEWWQHGLGIIESFDQPCEAVYSGWDRSGGYYFAEYRVITLPVYRCIVPRLACPDAAQMRRIRQIQRAINRAPYPYAKNRALQMLARWDSLAALEIPEIAAAIDFASDYGADRIAPDFGAGDFMSLNGEIVALDPFHHLDIHTALRLSN